jgi:serine/threonine-protein kinase
MPAPTRLGKYELRRELGKGSMGVVYEAFDTVIERLVAIKIIRQDEFGAAHTSELAAELIARLRREAQAAGRLNHPGIVSVYDFGEDATVGGGGIAYIAMELVDGRELKELLDGGRRFTPAEAVRILGEVLGALQHAHDRGVTHRDIKPGNVILLADGGVKLADFGIARIERSELTQAGTLIGTPMYMSPEQILGLPVDGRSDLFSCGVLLYELLTGRKPFNGSVTTVIQQVLNVEPEPPSRVNVTLGPDWDLLLQRALAKKPEDRFANARQFAQAMRETLARHGDEATVVMAVPPMPPVPAAAARPARRGRTALAAGAIALAGAAGLYALLRPAPPADAAARTSVAPPAPALQASSEGPPAAPSAAAPSAPATAAQPTSPSAAAPTPASSPRAAPRPKAEPSRPSAVPPAPAPPPPAPANDWPARLARINKLKPDTTLTQALRRLLDPLSAAEQQTMADFEALLHRQPASTGLAMGIKNGYFHYWWVRSAAGPASAGIGARKRCEERHGITCHPVLVDGALQPEGFTAVARDLGAKPPEAVRAELLQAFALSITNARQPSAASAPAPVPAPSPAKPVPAAPQAPTPAPASASRPSPASASPPSARPAVPAPATASTPSAASAAAGWNAARAKLRGPAAPQDLAGALAVLLQAEAPADLAVLGRLQAHTKRQRWNSAVAMGVLDGRITWRSISEQPRADWAREKVLSQCTDGGGSNCVIVAANGEAQLDAVRALAGRLGARSQAEVRQQLLKTLDRHVP